MTAKWRTAALAVAIFLVSASAAAAAVYQKNQTLPYGELNWDRGYVKVSAVGLPPFGAVGVETARANAVSAAQKRLLSVLLDLDVKGGKVRDRLAGHDELKTKLRGLVFAASVKGKNYADGSVEVTLTMPLNGPNGLQAFLDTL
ncbi:MAG: putative exported protein [Cyanobacteria bacterium RYN_339]|nr:putative exported protein [Cyanobacteria bacterium RYN_339]